MRHTRSSTRHCPCGDIHVLSGNAAAGAALRDTVPVLTRFGAWYVPYAFAIIHGVRSETIAAAALKYGFDPVLA